MISQLLARLSMGGYGPYVWSAVSVVVLMMFVQVYMSLKSFKRIKQHIRWKLHED